MSKLIPIGSMVELKPYAKRAVTPIGIVVGHKNINLNIVKWINTDHHHQEDGGYLNGSLKVLNEVKQYGS